uniref:RNA-directed DNA polymerase n=1 Tax=Globodera rostochiensis TaxID=31243 RepID=A0A914GZL9_GLORO
MASFFRKHIPNFSTIVEPLTRLTKKEHKFQWSAEQQSALDKIKEILTSAPILAFPDYNKPFHVFTDASLVGQGGALMQKDENNLFHAIAYCSRTLSSAERKWPPVQVELSAIIFALREFRGFIYLAEIELHTDHRPLSFLMKKAETAPNLSRWLIELQNYNIKIVHVSGKENSLADALSRANEHVAEKEVQSLKELEDIAEFPVCLFITTNSRIVIEPFINQITVRNADGNPYSVDLVKEQSEDAEVRAFIEDPVLNIEQLLDPKLRMPITLSPDGDFKAKLVLCLRKAWEAANEFLSQKRIEMKKQYDKFTKSMVIETGDRVLLKNYIVVPGSARKWHMPWRGIFRVVGKDQLHLTIVSCSSPQSNPFKVHINQRKRVFRPSRPARLTNQTVEEQLQNLSVECGNDQLPPGERETSESEYSSCAEDEFRKSKSKQTESEPKGQARYIVSTNIPFTICTKATTSPKFASFPNFLRLNTDEEFAPATKILINSYAEENAGIFNHLIVDHRAEKWEAPAPIAQTEGLGIVLKLEERHQIPMAQIITAHSATPVWVKSLAPSSPLQQFDICTAYEVGLSPGTQICEDYIIPNIFKIAPAMKRASTNNSFPYKITEKSQISPLHKNAIGLALRCLAANADERCKNAAITGTVEFVRTNNKHTARYRAIYVPGNLRELVRFRELWHPGVIVNGRKDPFTKAVATGYVASIFNPHNQLTTEIEMNLRCNDYNLEEEGLIYTVPSDSKRLEQRAMHWFSSSITVAAEENSACGEITRKIINLPAQNQNIEKAPIPLYKKAELNTEQCQFISEVLYTNHSTHLCIAPPGTGKTYTLAALVSALLSQSSEAVVACLTQTNISLLKMVEDISAVTDSTALLVQSSTARDELTHLTQQFRKFLTIAQQEELGELEGRDAMIIKKYRKTVAKKPRMLDEKEAVRVIWQNLQPRILYATLAMAEDLIDCFKPITHILIDEAGMASRNAIGPIIALSPNLEKLVLTGDPMQLGVFLADIPDDLQKFGFESVLNIRPDAQVKLKVSYRGHPFITECLAKAIYGEDIKAGVSAEERSLVINNLPLPNNSPIVLISMKSAEKRDKISFSFSNLAQTNTAQTLLSVLERTFAPNISIVVICLYAHQAAQLKARNNFRSTILTVDAYQAQQAQIIVLLTTRSRNIAAEHEEALSFLTNSHRSVVALSRAIHALFLVGDFDLLRRGRIWRKFIDHAATKSGIVGAEYIQQLQAFSERPGVAQHSNRPAVDIPKDPQPQATPNEPSTSERSHFEPLSPNPIPLPPTHSSDLQNVLTNFLQQQVRAVQHIGGIFQEPPRPAPLMFPTPSFGQWPQFAHQQFQFLPQYMQFIPNNFMYPPLMPLGQLQLPQAQVPHMVTPGAHSQQHFVPMNGPPPMLTQPTTGTAHLRPLMSPAPPSGSSTAAEQAQGTSTTTAPPPQTRAREEPKAPEHFFFR